MKIFVDCTRAAIGDCFFASSLAKCLKTQYIGCEVFYYIPLVQPLLLLQQNPYIDGVSTVRPITYRDFDLVINIPEVNQSFPATLWMQSQAGIPEEFQELAFEVYTVSDFDDIARDNADHFRSTSGKKVITYQSDWEWRSYACTPETLAQGIGAPHRNMARILSELRNEYFMIRCGFDRTVNNFNPSAADAVGYAKTASIIKASEYFLGAEGGLQNLAASVGTKTIYTTDFIHQNYGINGRIRKCDPPQMGSCVYFPSAGHTALDPCIKDEDITSTIKGIINGH